MKLWCCMFYFSFLGRDTVVSRIKYALFVCILCVCFRPQQPWVVELSVFNLNLDLKFTLRKEKTTFLKGNDGAVLAPLLLFLSPVPTLPFT